MALTKILSAQTNVLDGLKSKAEAAGEIVGLIDRTLDVTALTITEDAPPLIDLVALVLLSHACSDLMVLPRGDAGCVGGGDMTARSMRRDVM